MLNLTHPGAEGETLRNLLNTMLLAQDIFEASHVIVILADGESHTLGEDPTGELAELVEQLATSAPDISLELRCDDLHVLAEPIQRDNTRVDATLIVAHAEHAFDKADRARLTRLGRIFANALKGAQVHDAEDILHNMSSGFFAVDRSWRLSYTNPYFEEFVGQSRDQLIGEPLSSVLIGVEETELMEHMLSVMHTRTPTHIESWFESLQSWMDVHIYPSHEGIVIFFLDNTAKRVAEDERRALETRYLHAQKLESIGQMTSGIAHDFSNLLMVIMTSASLLEEQLPRASVEATEELDELMRATQRAARLTRQLLQFSRRESAQTERLDLRELIADLVQMLERILPATIIVRHDLPDAEVTTIACRVHLEQIVTNLIINARDAIESVGGHGKITITLRTTTTRTQHGESVTGATIEVADTGVGMTQTTARQIFEPFFTTKKPGRGTGLGLATVDKLVRDQGGTITVNSNPGQGTQFCITLPTEPLPSPHQDHSPSKLRPNQRQRVLLVEDDEAVRRTLSKVLSDAGYLVTEVTNALRALEALDETSGFVAVISDIVMPTMRGVELRERLQLTHPHLPVILMTGFAEEIAQLAADESIALLRKPFRPGELLESLTRLIS